MVSVAGVGAWRGTASCTGEIKSMNPSPLHLYSETHLSDEGQQRRFVPHPLTLLYYPHPFLRKVCRPVERFDSTLRDVADEMTALMQSRSGIGLAAPQVGLEHRLLVCGLETQFMALANVRVLESAQAGEFVEGCLSLPGVMVKVRRPERIRVSGYDVHGCRKHLAATGLWARVIQHELDHLNGVLICDYEHPSSDTCRECALTLPSALVEERKRRSHGSGTQR